MGKHRDSKFAENNRYQYEFSTDKPYVKATKDSSKEALAKGANLQGAFTNNFNTEFAQDHDIKSNNEKTKERFQEELQQNYNLELSDDMLINKNKDCK